MIDDSENIKINLTEKTELTFTVQIEAPELSKPEFRFVICESDDDAHMFTGRSSSDGEINVIVPPMKQRLSEGTYDARLEVIINDKYFVPLELGVEFAQPIRVQVESVKTSELKQPLSEEKQQPKPRTKKDDVQIKVSPAVVKKSEKVVKSPPQRGSLAARYNRKKKDK